MGVPHEIRGNGSAVLVPADQVPRLRMAMAQEGLPTGGSIGYEIFDSSERSARPVSSRTSTTCARSKASWRARSRSMGRVQQRRASIWCCRRRELFSRDQQEPTASVVLQMTAAAGSTRAQVAGDPAPGRRRRAGAEAAQDLDHRRPGHPARPRQRRRRRAAPNARPPAPRTRSSTYEARVARMIEEMLERVAGTGKVRAEVAAEMDFDRITTSSETFDPDGQVVRSTQNVEETSRSRDAETPERRVGRHQPPGSDCRSSRRRPPSAARPPSRTAPRRPSTTRSPRPQGPCARERRRQAPLGRGAGRRQLRRQRQRPAQLPAAQRRGNGAAEKLVRSASASTRSAATRSRSSTCASSRAPTSPRTAARRFFGLEKDDYYPHRRDRGARRRGASW